MELTAITLSTLSLLAAIAFGYAILRARTSIRSLRKGITRSSVQNKEMTKRISGLEEHVQKIDQSLRPVIAQLRRLANDQDRIIERLRAVEADRTHLRRDLEELTEVTNRISDDTETLITWMRVVVAKTKRSTELPSGPKPELRLKEEIDSIIV